MFEKVASDPMDQSVANWLLENGIHRVVVGHKPLGDSPAILSSRYTGVEIVSADTSYSDTSSPDNRGSALSIVEIVGSSQNDNRLEVKGTFHDGTSYHNVYPRLISKGRGTSKRDISISESRRKYTGRTRSHFYYAVFAVSSSARIFCVIFK